MQRSELGTVNSAQLSWPCGPSSIITASNLESSPDVQVNDKHVLCGAADFEASLRPGVLTTRSAIPAASACMVCETFPSRSGIHWQYFTCTQLARVRSLFSTITSAQLHRCCFFLLRACTHADSENATPAMQRTDDARTIDLEHALRGLARFDRSTRRSSGSLVLLCLGGGCSRV